MLIFTPKKLFFTWLFLLAILANSIGCASYGPSSRSAKDTGVNSSVNSDAKNFTTKKDKTNIYVYRNGLDTDVMMPISLNGKLIAKTTSKTFLKLTIDPGRHEISSEEGGFSSVTINTQAGKNYYVFQEIIFGISATGANLQEVSESEGQLGVQECKLIKTTL